jgi:hypothetical protein
MDVDELIEHREMPRGVGQSLDWYTLASWPKARDVEPRLMLALQVNAMWTGPRSSALLWMSQTKRGISRRPYSRSAIGYQSIPPFPLKANLYLDVLGHGTVRRSQ